MAIVHPAFCRYVGDSMEPIGVHGITFAQRIADLERGSRSRIKIVDTKHFKNRVYSSRTVDVFSGSVIAARQ
jgi:hypothetical protein